ncbi:MAG: smalltalk protein [Prevotella sp.]|nr:smalltalk protein [Prevotella sp.]
MKNFTLKRVVEIIITILTAIVTTLGTQSCMG